MLVAGYAESRKVRVGNALMAQQLIEQGGKLVADYGGFQVIESEAPTNAFPGLDVQSLDESDVIELNVVRINTRSAGRRVAKEARARFNGKRLHLVQFAAPIKPEWRATLEQTGARIIDHIPHNAYLVSSDADALARIDSWAAADSTIQWTGEYLSDYKLQPGARLTDAYGFPQLPNTDTFAIQLLDDAEANLNTRQLIDQLKLEPVKRQFRTLQFVNLVVRLPVSRLGEIAAQSDVVSIHPYFDPEKRDERQAQIIAGNLTGAGPSAPGYLAWLRSKGFTQEQFDASAFVVDVTDSGVDNGTTQPGHFGLYRSGNPGQPSRVVYNRLEGFGHPGGSVAGCDGHGNLNAHILAGYNDFTGGFPHADPQGFRYGLGICPFVRVGASVVFDPDLFTNPNYADLQSRAFQSGARISANSWGMTNNSYTVDAQAFDALVRDAQPDGAAFAEPGNQEMVVVFAAGNRGSAGFNTVGAPGTAKNVITIGASEGVRSLNLASGGNSAMGSDGCGFNDVNADGAFDLAAFSSRGPCSDGRQKPDLVAPGTHITGGVAQSAIAAAGNGFALACFKASSLCALNGSGVTESTNNFFPLGQQFYTVSSGTSHAAPAVAGAGALLRQFFINNGLPVPSAAMTKAFLMNSARYLTGAGANDNLWSSGQGMGEVNLGRAFDGVARVLRDQRPEDLFAASGQMRIFTGKIADANQALRITLAWTDAPGSTVGAALNNDLDLTVTFGTNTYRGNNFAGAFSTPGGNADAKNNVESVLLPAGSSGDIIVRITAANINSDGVPGNGNPLDQDFALVIYNAEATTLPLISPADSELTAESCVPMNHAVDDGETVSLSIGLKNTGTAEATNLTVELLPVNGVVSPSETQNYGALPTNGIVVSRQFTFKAKGVCGDSIKPVLALQDGSNHLGTLTLSLPLGLASVQTSTFSNATPISIPDSGKASLYPSIINVNGLTGVVTKVSATLRGYSHSWPDDVDVLLVSPTGQKVMLMADCGGGNVRSNVTLTFDDASAGSLPDASGFASGTYKPTNFDTTSDNFPAPAPSGPFGPSLSVFKGQDPNGPWSLYVQDDGSLDSGSITQGWMLSITTSNLSCCDSSGEIANLQISATMLASAVLGSNVSIVVTVSNSGSNPAAFVSVTNQLPSGLSFVSATVSQGICRQADGTVFSSLGMLDSGASATLVIQAQAVAEGAFTNTVFAASFTPDSQWSDNSSVLPIVVRRFVAPGEGDLELEGMPRLLNVPDRTVHAGSLVVVTNSVVGSTNALTYSLDAGAPLDSFINPASGLLTWQTSDANVNTTNLFTVRVIDNGTPAWQGSKTFAVTVAPRPLIAGIAAGNSRVAIAWNSLIGQMYRLEYSTNFSAAVWSDASPDLVATSTVTSHTNYFDPAVWHFYRVRVLP
ncbi:MAG TPA: S8 family serine peptidase [Verrucomicrobiae bacterium]|nr:S8 family serine peptidase [Verrucomicrobiae bacterium]